MMRFKLQQQLLLILIATIQTCQVKNNNVADLICTDGGKHFLIFWTVCIAPGVAAVTEYSQICKSMFLGIVSKPFLLVLRTGRRHGAVLPAVYSAI